MTTSSLTFIGGGNMANSIIGGLIQQGYTPENITACDPNQGALDALAAQFGIQTNTDNAAACANTDVIVLAVKPQILKTVTQAIGTAIAQRTTAPLIISIAAGIASSDIQQWLGQDIAIVRCMPNTPALVQQGASGLYANVLTSQAQKNIAEQLLQAVGYVTWVDSEALIDSVTAVSGSGPAYFFLLMEAMIDAGVKQGLSKESATQLTLQTALGAATLAKASDVSVAELRKRVTSPGGTTAAAIQHYEEASLSRIVEGAMSDCSERSKAMAKEFT
jgi:pyrroline-5-carboxylate reductase